ncbi:hypothetical protein JXA85_01535 [Candidatus Woesearchaeota archaeon]|nr:hypothetical protein [Candidatus Woesearchaeota archaeon]
MIIHGSVSRIKKAVEKRYDKLYAEIRKNADRQIDMLRKESNENLSGMRKEHRILLSRERHQLYTKLLNEEKLRLRLKQNDLKERLIRKVLEKVRKDAKAIILTQSYIDFVKSRVRGEKNLSCVGSSESYRKHFQNFRIDRTINGTILEGNGTIFDFTVDSLLESKKDELRYIASRKLFGE